MPFSDWNLEAAEELGYERALEEEKEKEHAKRVGISLAKYMGLLQ